MDGSQSETGPVAATAWVAARLGAPTDALEIRTVDVGPPGPNQVRVATETFCLDFNDIDTIRGRYGLLKFEPPFVAGMVAAGVVDAVGPGAEALLGRRVVGVTVGVQGGYASPRCSMQQPSRPCPAGSASSTGSPCTSPTCWDGSPSANAVG